MTTHISLFNLLIRSQLQ